jgi:hypothetical protein
VEILGIFFYVDVKRDEVLIYERRQTGVCIRLVLKSLAGSSGGRGAEVDKRRLILISCSF